MPPQLIEVSSSAGRNPDQRVLTCRGPLTMHTLGPLRDALQTETSRVLILDIHEVTQVDSAGMGMLLQLQATFERTSRRLAIAGAAVRIRNLFDVTGISNVLVLFSTRGDAEQALS